MVSGIAMDKKTIDLTGYDLFARNYSDIGEYIEDLAQFIKDARGR